MTARFKLPQPKKTLSRPFTNGATSVRGEIACIDTSTGKFDVVSASTTLLAVGYFQEDNITGDGSTPINVDLFENIQLHYFNNDTAPNAVTEADIASTVYLKDGRTVSMSSAGSTRSTAGLAMVLDPIDGVGVLFGLPVKGATGATGIGVAQSVADRDALSAIAAADRANGVVVVVRSDGSTWIFDSASAIGEDEQQQIVVQPDAGTGRWIRADKCFDMKLAISKDTADAAALCTVPAGFALRLVGLPFWDVTTGFTGGTAAAIGISSDQAGSSTKGDLLGGATGDVTATLGTAGIKPGTIGAKVDTLAEQQAVYIPATKKLRFDRITDAFTAGVGFVHVPVALCRIG